MKHHIRDRRRTALCLGVATTVASFVATAAPVTTLQERVSQRLIVRYHDSPAPAQRELQVRRTLNGAMARAGVASPGLSPGIAAAGAQALRRLGTGAELIQLPPLRAGEVQRLVDEIAADPAVRYVEPDSLQQPFQQAENPQPNDPLYASHQWHFHDPIGGVNAARAWNRSRGAGVVVAVLDTGILPDHPDFQGAQLLPGYDFISDPFMSRRAQAGRVAGALDRGDWSPEAGECHPGSRIKASGWHGTHVAGTIAQRMNNQVGGTGLAPDVTLLPVRVLGRCGGTVSDIADAITWASGGSVPGVPDNADPAQVINLSLGGQGHCSWAYQDAIDAAVQRGTLVVVAAGNSNLDAGGFRPASCGNVVTVAATGVTGRKAGYSNHGASVDISAPGGGQEPEIRGFVWQTSHTGRTTPESGTYTYRGEAGTSMATPHVAATAALVQSARSAAGRLPLSAARMEALLQQTARPFPVAPAPAAPIGRGILDAAAALDIALSDHCDIAAMDCQPPEVLQPQVPASGQAAGAVGRRYTFTATAGRPLRVMTYGGSGNATVYVRRGAPPQADRFDARSARAGNHQAVLIGSPAADVYHVWLAGGPAFEGLTVVVRQ